MQVLNYVRRWLGRPLVAPLGADAPTGQFELIGRRCVGSVIDACNPTFSDMVVELQSANSTILRSLFIHSRVSSDRYEFSFDLDPSIDLYGFLTEDLVIYALNSFGLRSKLRLDGASQLSLIREFSGTPRDVLFDLNFTPEGNSRQYIKEGFSSPEPKFTWSDGPKSRIEVAVPISRRDRHELTISCFPFLAPPAITSQRMLLHLNGYTQNESLDGKQLDFLSFKFSTESLNDGNAVTVEFEFPDCFRPVDAMPAAGAKPNRDQRQLAFAFKRMTFARLLAP